MSDKRKFRELLIHCSFINALAKHHHIIAPNEFHLKEDDTALQNPELWIKFIEHSAYLALEAEALKLEAALELALSFAPKGPVPKDLPPMFYHTLSYEEEVKLQVRVDEAREALAQFKKWRGGE